AAPPRPTPTAVEAPPEPELAADQLAEIDEALAEAGPEVEAPPAPPEPAVEIETEVEAPPEPEPEVLVKPRFRDRLGKARSLLAGYVGSVLSRSGITDETWDEI